MRHSFTSLLLLGGVLASGCSIQQTVTPAAFSPGAAPVICMIPAPGLRPGFHTRYERLLREKGFQTRQLAPDSNPASCALSTTYIGRWSWDFTIYMSYADIRVFQQGRQIGQAEYDSRSGGMSFSKWINADAKIAELTQQLFPDRVTDMRAVAQPAAGSLSREAYRQQQLEQLSAQGLPYDEYQRRYQEIMSD